MTLAAKEDSEATSTRRRSMKRAMMGLIVRFYAMREAIRAYRRITKTPTGRLEAAEWLGRASGKRVMYDGLLFEEGRGFVPINPRRRDR